MGGLAEQNIAVVGKNQITYCYAQKLFGHGKWYFITFTGATTSRFSCGNSENEFLPIINEYFAFPELKPV